MRRICLLIWVMFSVPSLAVSLGERVTVSSSILDQPHELLIYTPPSYDYGKSKAFPVLYIMDGDYNFHYLTGLIELWSNISTSIPEMIVVGISGKDTQNYRKLVKPPLKPESGESDAGNADLMLRAIEKEIIPHINETHKVNGFEVLGGHSLGGLFVTYAAVHEPQLFDRFVAVSPSLWWQGEIMKSHVSQLLEKKKDLNANLYMTLANEKGMGVHGFVEMFESKRRPGFEFKFKHFPDENHGSVGMESYKWAFFDVFEAIRLSGRFFDTAQAVIDYEAKLKVSLGLVMPIPSGYLRNSCYAWCGDEKKRNELDLVLNEKFPNDVAFFRVLVAEFLMSENKLEDALGWYKKAEQSAPEYVVVHHGLVKLYGLMGKKNWAKKARDKVNKLLKTQRIRQWQRNELQVY